MRQTIIGFDSAWADNSPGGICSLTLDKGKIVEFLKPRLVRFSDAALFVQTAKNHSAYVLIALDQPTLVPNSSGIRPVERVAGAIVNRIGGGVQPTNTPKVSMFGRSAPIWSFSRYNKRERKPGSSEKRKPRCFSYRSISRASITKFDSWNLAAKTSSEIQPRCSKFFPFGLETGHSWNGRSCQKTWFGWNCGDDERT